MRCYIEIEIKDQPNWFVRDTSCPKYHDLVFPCNAAIIYGRRRTVLVAVIAHLLRTGHNKVLFPYLSFEISSDSQKDASEVSRNAHNLSKSNTKKRNSVSLHAPFKHSLLFI